MESTLKGAPLVWLTSNTLSKNVQIYEKGVGNYTSTILQEVEVSLASRPQRGSARWDNAKMQAQITIQTARKLSTAHQANLERASSVYIK